MDVLQPEIACKHCRHGQTAAFGIRQCRLMPSPLDITDDHWCGQFERTLAHSRALQAEAYRQATGLEPEGEVEVMTEESRNGTSLGR